MEDSPYPYPQYIEIPTNNEKFSPLSSSYYMSALDSIASVTVDIPDDCRSIAGWGVAVIVALETQAPKHSKETDKGFMKRDMRLSWKFDPWEPGDGPSLSLFASSSARNDLYLFIMTVSGDFIYIQQHPRGDRNLMSNNRFSKHRRPEFKENSSLQFEVRVKGCKIRKCGWRVLRNNGVLIEEPFNFEHSSGFSKLDEFEKEEEDAALDVLQNENFSSVTF